MSDAMKEKEEYIDPEIRVFVLEGEDVVEASGTPDTGDDTGEIGEEF